MSDDTAGLLVALVAENADLRRQLSEAQDLLIETAIDAGSLHGVIEALQEELAALRRERSISIDLGRSMAPRQPHDAVRVAEKV